MGDQIWVGIMVCTGLQLSTSACEPKAQALTTLKELNNVMASNSQVNSGLGKRKRELPKSPLPTILESNVKPKSKEFYKEQLNIVDHRYDLSQEEAPQSEYTPPEEQSADDILKENQRLKRAVKCRVCQDNKVQIVTLPCSCLVIEVHQ